MVVHTRWPIYSIYQPAILQGGAGQNIDHGRLLVLIEASEESGSIHLPQHLGTLKERIGTPNLIVCLDSGCGEYSTAAKHRGAVRSGSI
jgi:hypothetical protein